jgi:uncharacterized protein with HEPN domain
MIRDARDEIARFLTNIDRESFLDDKILQNAVLFQLTVIGEAASKVGQELRGATPIVQWRQIAAMRNFIVHVYFSVNLDVINATAREDLPVLREQIQGILDGLVQ